jgi:hypothetical protein
MEKPVLDLNINFTIQQLDGDTGIVKKEVKVHNIVVNTGLDRVANLIGGLSGAHFEHLGIGTGATSEVSGNTTLETEYTRENVVPTDEGVGIIKYDNTFTVASGVSESITEAGLFDQLIVGGSTMLNRTTFTAFTLDSDNPLRVIATITVSTV